MYTCIHVCVLHERWVNVLCCIACLSLFLYINAIVFVYVDLTSVKPCISWVFSHLGCTHIVSSIDMYLNQSDGGFLIFSKAFSLKQVHVEVKGEPMAASCFC